MTCVVRIEALRALGALIEAAIPEVAGHVCVGDTPSSEFEHVPNISIEPTKWKLDPEQQNEHAALPGNVVVWKVGDLESGCVISVVAASRTQRAQLEAKVIDLFLSQRHPLTGMPLTGCIVLPVVACPQLSQWLAIFDLESDEWNNTLALDRRYESRIVCNANIPALTIERPVYTLNELLLGLATTGGTPAPSPPPAVELVIINEDGTLSRP